ncbi:17-beta-hydroxysteroid dehydrogenase 13-like isoform X2 [Coccinella septempunctata]|uniref:17-beta-hydroxysteroid dehydrogenase 13-like isoform X2 n=1 Tax=Coccinella septempunctata TaxID=41139 RepID=UPI001D06F7EE|nr:17-beta-hydroxysteroid dehydrogenase 13-like isoform X2 [Coccinella septempunctata]
MAGLRKSDAVLTGYTSKSSPGDASNLANKVFQILEVILFTLLWIFYILYCTGEKIYQLFNRTQPRSVKNDIVLITGTGHGIGRELALKYAAEGATIVGWDINKENNDCTIQQLNEVYPKKAFGYVVDVADPDSVVNTAKLVEKEVGQVTIIIANAGIMPCHPLLQHSREEIRRIMNINVFQLFWLMEAFLPTMLRNNRGHIVVLSSVAGLAGFPNLVPYCASKFAVRGLMESLHEELRLNRSNQINFTTIYPFMVDTGLCKHPRVKFNTLMKMLKPERVAYEIMMAQRTNVNELSVPSYLLTLQSILRLLPQKAVFRFVDFLDSGLESDLQKNASD